MLEKFGEIKDREVIEDFEKRESANKVKFESASTLIKNMEKKYKKAI